MVDLVISASKVLSVITNTLTRNDFLFLHRNLLLKTQEIEKIRTILKENFQRLWVPYESVAIDETIVFFRGRYRFRVKIQLKPNSNGLKLFLAADEKSFIINYFIPNMIYIKNLIYFRDCFAKPNVTIERIFLISYMQENFNGS